MFGRTLLLLGGVNGRNPPRFPLSAGADGLTFRSVGVLLAAGLRVLLLGGVNGRNPPRFPLSAGADGLMFRSVGMLLAAGVRVLLLGGVNGRNPPRFPLSAGADGLTFRSVGVLLAARVLLLGGVNGPKPPRLLVRAEAFWLPVFLAAGILLFTLRLNGVPALGFCMVPFAVPRASTEPLALARPPACTGVTRFRCNVCCTRETCCWNGTGRAAAPDLPKKCCCPPRIVDGAAARPLADKLACVGTTGTFPVIMRAVRNWLFVAATARTRPAPK
jgi:hypothetical protein